MASGTPEVVGFFDEKTFSVQYLCIDTASKRCAIIDPVLNYDEKAASTSTECADEIAAFVQSRGLTVDWILDTHPHADHLSAGDLSPGPVRCAARDRRARRGRAEALEEKSIISVTTSKPTADNGIGFLPTGIRLPSAVLKHG